MKIRNNSRILALVLALVMILPLISIPVFADGADSENPESSTSALVSYDFENYKDKAADEVLAADTVLNVVAPQAYAKKDGEDTVIEVPFGETNKDKPTKVVTPALSYETTPFVVFEGNYYISSAAEGPVNVQLQSIKYGPDATKKNWIALGNIDTVNNKVGSSAANVFKDDTWFKVQWLVDLVRGNVIIYVDGAQVASSSLGVTNIKVDANMWIMGKTDLSNKFTTTGFYRIDDVVVWNNYVGKTPNPYALNPYSEDFEGYEVGTEPKGSFSAINVADSKVSDTYGSKAWGISFERPGENKYNVDKNPMLKNGKASYEFQDKVVYEVAYFFEPDAVGQIQNQFTGSTAHLNGATTASSVSWVDIYQIAFSNGNATLKFESAADTTVQDIYDKTGNHASNGKTYSFPASKWNTVTAVIDLDTGLYDMYVNGELAIGNVQFYRGGVMTDITIEANKIITGGKVNKVNGAGTFYLDNIKFFEGDAPTVAPSNKDAEDFSDYVYLDGKPAAGRSVPSLATFKVLGEEKNVVVNLPLATTSAEGSLALLRADARKVFAWDVTIDPEDPTIVNVPADNPTGVEDYFNIKLDEDMGLYYAYYIGDDGETEVDLNDQYYDEDSTDRYYLVDASVAELALGTGGNIGMALKIHHKGYSYKDNDVVVLTADYFLEEGAKGVIEAQFESYYYDTIEGEGEEAVATSNAASWIQLYYFDMATGQFEGLDEYMTVGAWNNVKVLMNLDTGVYEIYLNNALVKTESVGHTNLTIGVDAGSTFSAAKIQRTVSFEGELAGNLIIDNVGVNTKIPADSDLSDGFFSDEAYINNLSNAIVTVKDPTIRFEGYNGIRFVTKVNDDFLAGIKKNFGENAIVNMGTLIAPLDYVAAAGAFTKEALAALETDTEANYIDLPFEEYFESAIGVNYGAGNFFTASIVNIKEANIARDFAAVAYVTVQIAEGDVRTYYAKGIAVANAQQTAANQLAASEASDWTEAQLAVLNGYAGELEVAAPEGASSENPIGLMGDSATVTIDHKRTFFGGMMWADHNLTITGPEGFKLWLNGEIIESVEGKIFFEKLKVDGFMFVFALIGEGTYNFLVEVPLGSMDNPYIIESIEDVINVKVGEGETVYYKWISTVDGFVVLNTSSVNGTFYLYNPTLNLYPDPIEGAGSVKVPVTVGAEIMIDVSTIPPEATEENNFWPVNPAGEVAFTLTTEAAAAITPSIKVELALGDCYVVSGAAQMLAGKVFTLENENVLVWHNGEYMTADENGVFSFTLAANDNGTCSLVFKAVDGNREDEITPEKVSIDATIAEPVAAGTMENPAALVVGDNAVSLAAGNNQGYYYTYTPEAAGTMTFKISSITEGTEGDVVVMVGMAQKNIFADGVDGVLTVAVNAGEAISVQVVVIPDASWNIPASDITVAVTFEATQA